MPIRTTRSEVVSETEALLTDHHHGDEDVDTIATIIDNLSALAGLSYRVSDAGVASLSPTDPAQVRLSTTEGDR